MNGPNSKGFKLLEVQLGREHFPVFEGHGSARGEGAKESGHLNQVTLVVGKNGSGKSRLLAGIAEGFGALNGRRSRLREPIVLGYELDGQACELEVDKGAARAVLNNQRIASGLLPGPAAILAVTASAFDKFPLPRAEPSTSFKPQRHDTRSSPYLYFGLKDARGRVSAKAGVIRALEKLFDASGEEAIRRNRVADVFRYLSYRPQVEVVFLWTRRGRLLLDSLYQLTSADELRRYFEDLRTGESASSRPTTPNYMFEEEFAFDEMLEALHALLPMSTRDRVRLVADFRGSNESGNPDLRMARLLGRAGLLEMTDVNLQNLNGQTFGITEASSGQLSIFVTMLGIASVIQDNCLVLIDEPEISLHPEWQFDYVTRLMEAFEAYTGCHFVIVTHSPTLVAGSAGFDLEIVDLDTRGEPIVEKPRGKSADQVLLETFGVVSKDNLYLRELLVTALRAAEDGDLGDSALNQLFALLQSVKAELPAADSARELIERLINLRLRLGEGT